MNKIAVIDYGMGNLHSVAKAVEHAGNNIGEPVEVIVSANAKEILAADRVIFPGVGAIRDCMAEILRLGIGKIVEQVVKDKPLLGICVGMQALMTRSEENHGVDCLGRFKGQVRLFDSELNDTDGSRLKVPHMGWNTVKQASTHPLWQGIEDNTRFYFVHSYYVDADAEMDGRVTGVTEYGNEFTSAIAAKNIFAVQFHPEKSQTPGLTLLQNFLQWDGSF